MSSFIHSPVFGFKTSFIASKIAVFPESLAQIRTFNPFSKFRSKLGSSSKLFAGQYFLKFQSFIFDRYISKKLILKL
jgi:hypothetical protein